MNHVVIVYENWRKETAERRVAPVPPDDHFKVYFGSTAWHPVPQWLFDAFDLDKGCVRTFAVGGVKSWRSGGTEYEKLAGHVNTGSGV